MLNQGYYVVGIDNLSKYGQIIRNHSDNKNYKFIEGDVKDKNLLRENLIDCDYLIAGAAMMGAYHIFMNLNMIYSQKMKKLSHQQLIQQLKYLKTKTNCKELSI